MCIFEYKLFTIYSPNAKKKKTNRWRIPYKATFMKVAQGFSGNNKHKHWAGNARRSCAELSWKAAASRCCIYIQAGGKDLKAHE